MKRTKGLIALLLAVIMLMSAMPMTAFAESLVDMNGETDKYIWSYTAISKTLYFNIKDEITGDDRVVDDDLNNMLPTYYNQADLEALDDMPLNAEDINKIIIGNNILSMNYIMFSDSYANLTEVVFEENSVLNNIADNQFSHSPIKTIELPQSVMSIGKSAFAYSSLTSITLPESVETIGTKVFDHCSKLEKADLSKTAITALGSYTFDNCYALNDITLPEGITRIGTYSFRKTAIISFDFSQFNTVPAYSFMDCKQLSDIDLSSVTSIGNYAFSGCTAFQNADLKNVRTIGNYAFRNSGITSAELTNAESIGYYAFAECENLERVRCGKLTDISKYAFANSANLIDVDLAGVQTIAENAFENTSVTTVDLSSVKSIGNNAFTNCENLTYADFSSVESIGAHSFQNTGLTSVELFGAADTQSYSFADCPNLKTVAFNSTDFVSIYDYAFHNCASLTEVKLNPYVIEVCNNAFDGCIKLSDIDFPTGQDSEGNTIGIMYIDTDAFKDTSIKKVKLPSTVEWYSFSNTPVETVDISEVQLDNIPDGAFMGCKNITSYIVPEGYIAIGNSAFKDCTNLAEVTIPDSVESIYPEAFSGCMKIESINIPSKITGIESETFNGCTNLTNVTSDGIITSIDNYAFCDTNISNLDFAKNVTAIGDYAFAGCTGIISIAALTSLNTIGCSAFAGCTGLNQTGNLYGVQTIGASAFDGCTALKTAYFPSTLTSANKYVYTNSGITSAEVNSKFIGNCSFDGCTNLKSVKIMQDCTEIPNFAFDGTNIADVDTSLAEKLTKIGQNAFRNCKNLTGEFQVPKTVNTIDEYAFLNCTEIINFKFDENSEGVNINKGAFDGCTSLEELNIPCPVSFISNSMTNSKIKRLVTGAKTIINTQAFCNNTTLESVKLSGNVTLDDDAFYNVPTLTNLDLTNADIKFGGDSHFYGCGIEEFAVPSGVTSIPNSAFKNAKNLQHLMFADDSTLTTIGSGAFFGCDITGELNFPSTVQTIGSSAFKNNLHLKKIVLPAATTSVGSYAFQNCPLETVVSLNPETTSIYNNSIFYGANAKFDKGTIMSPITSNLKSFAAKYAFDYIAIDENGELINSVRMSGTWSNGEWLIRTNDYEHYDLTFIGEGEIDLASLKDSDGNAITVEQIITDNKDITTVTFGDGITAVPDRLFCFDETKNYNDSLVKNIKEINLAPSVKKIGAYAFYGVKLDSFTIPETVTELGEYTFGNSYIYDLTITAGVKSVTQYAFYNGNLTDIHINDGVERLEKACFQTKNNITNIYIPKSVKYIYSEGENSVNNAFSYKSNTIHVYGRKSTEGYYYSTSHLGISFHLILDTSMDYTHPAEYTATGTFNTTEGTGAGKWYYLEDTQTLYLTGSGMISAYHNFDCAYDVQTVVFEKGLTGYSTYDKTILEMVNPKYVYFSTSFTALSKDYLRGCTNLRSLIIPDSVTSVDSNLLSDCDNLRYIKFGGGMSMVPNEFCKNLKNLTAVDFNDGVSRIGAGAFENCTGLKEIILSYGITKVDSNAFNKCVNVVKLKINEKLFDIGSKSFSNLAYCEEIEFDSSNLLSNIGMSTVKWFESFKNLGASTTGTTLRLGNDVTEANLRAFDSTRITEIIIGDNVSSIKDITNLPYLQEVTVSDSNSNYYSWGGALYSNDNCLVLAPSQIDNLEIKPGTVKIGDYAFSNSFIDSVTIPDTVNEIGNYAFYNCKELETIDLPGGLTTIGNSAFENCSALRIFYSPSKLNTIGERAFANCTHLGTAVLSSNRLTEIKSEAFIGCTALIGMVIPENVLNVGDRAYMNCPELTEIYIWSAEIGADAFKNDNKLTIYTMAGTDAYRYARECGEAYSAYTDEDMFFDLCADKVIIYAGYLGYCTDGHGDVQWLTVYEADCENDGYMIGVCEYCSEIIDEKHIKATGHSYTLTADIPAGEKTKGMSIYTCEKCGDRYCNYTPATGDAVLSETHTVSGSVVLSLNNEATSGKAPAKNVSIVIDGNTVASTDKDGFFSFELESGSYEAELRYAYGFARTVYIVVEDSDVEYMNIPIIACDFNKDGKIDDGDYAVFNIVISSSANDPSYLDFVDMNNDGYINAKDRLYIKACYGLDAKTFNYPVLIIQK